MLSKGTLIYHECVQLNLIFQLRTNLHYKLSLYLSHHFDMIYIYWLGFGLHVDHIQLVLLQWLNIQSSTIQTIIDVHFCGVQFYNNNSIAIFIQAIDKCKCEIRTSICYLYVYQNVSFIIFTYAFRILLSIQRFTYFA